MELCGPVDSDADGASERIGSECFRIAHLSDLHFGSGFNLGLWNSVRQILEEYRPALVVISGDLVNTPSLFQLGLVSQELQAVIGGLGIEYLVVPGNHDVAIMGNVAIWPWSGKFRIVFGDKHRQYFSRLCTYSQFQSYPIWKKLAYRLWWGIRLAFSRCTFRLRDPGEKSLPLLVGDAANGRALFACLNSNIKLWLATGRVDHAAIQSLSSDLEKLSRGGTTKWLAPRIAIAHHHAISIPYSSTDESPTEFEPFLTMRNSGTLLRELGKLEFDVLLHGHKHFWNFARIAYGASGSEASEVAVIAAGSATLEHTGAGNNTVNLIDLMPNGTILHTPLFYGLGKTPSEGDGTDTTRSRHLLTLGQIKERAYRKAVRHLQCESAVLEREVILDCSGSADFALRVRGYRAFGGRRTSRVRLRLAVSFGGIRLNGVRFDDQTNNKGHRFDLAPGQLTTKNLDVPIILGAEAYDGREDPVEFGIRCRATNSFAITKWEASLLPSPATDEWVGITVRQPARQLKLVLQIPNAIRGEDAEVVFVCQRPLTYPALTCSDDGDVDVPALDGDWVSDAEMTSYEKQNLQVYEGGSDQLGKSTRYELTIDRPLVGYRYLLCWPVNAPLTDCGIGVRGQALQLRRTLLRMLDESTCPQYLKDKHQNLQEALDAIFDGYLQPTFRSPLMLDEGLVAAIFVYNDKERALDLLLESGANKPRTGRCERIPLNEGVVGRVFKARQLGLYVLPDLAAGMHEELYIYYESDHRPAPGDELCALLAIPLYIGEYPLPSDEPQAPMSAVPPEAMFGVLTLGTNATDSNLLQLVSKDGLWEEIEPELRSLVRRLTLGMIEELKEAVD